MTASSSILWNIISAIASAFARDANWLELLVFLTCWFFFRRYRTIRISERLTSIVEKPATAYATMLLLAVLPRIAILPVHGIPDPFVPDEFSHRFLADTFLHRRLANPVHPLWTHFETIHIFHQPTYSSMYLPLQGLFLAAGKALTGTHWWGVLLSSAAWSAALLWMLRGWFSLRWAYFGTLLATLRFGIVSYWIDSYWGGFVPAAAGALVVGAYARLRRHPTWNAGPSSAGWLLGLGLSGLAACRPYEGLVFSIPILFALAWRACKNFRLMKPILAAALIVAIATMGLATYNQHVTGSALTLPYAVNQKQYGWPMTLGWMHPAHIEFRHADLLQYFSFEQEEHRNITTLRGFATSVGWKLDELWRFYFGVALSVPLITLPFAVRGRQRQILWIILGLTLLAVLTEQSSYPHYASPAATCVVALWIACIRLLCRRMPNAAAAIAVTLATMLIVHLAVRIPAPVTYRSWCCSENLGYKRARIEQWLAGQPGQQLVFVHHNRKPRDTFDWVYNDPDIDQSAIVWARDMGEKENLAVLSYFAGRTAWFVEADADSPHIEHYSKHHESSITH